MYYFRNENFFHKILMTERLRTVIAHQRQERQVLVWRQDDLLTWTEDLLLPHVRKLEPRPLDETREN